MKNRSKKYRIVFSSSVLFSVSALIMAGGAEPNSDRGQSKPAPAKETVLITYHVIPGKEKELQELLARVWDVYEKERLVVVQPHVVISDKDAGGKTRFLEIFTWVSSEAPDHAPASVKRLWDQMQSCCEKRDGHAGLEGGEVELVVPRSG